MQNTNGYGNLMETASKLRFTPTAGPRQPVRDAGFKRASNVRGNQIGFSTTALGVLQDPAHDVAAALCLDRNLSDIGSTDKREGFYCRKRVTHSTISLLDCWQLPENADVWIYALTPEDAQPATARLPVVQSCMDNFLTGCQQ